MGKLGEKEAATERRRECTDIGLNLGKKDENVACYVSALALKQKEGQLPELVGDLSTFQNQERTSKERAKEMPEEERSDGKI